MVQNSADSGLGRFAEWWLTDGLRLQIVRAYEGDVIGSMDGFAALVMLGGGLLPDEDERGPWLAAERAAAVEALHAGLPTFGICLCAQLLAHVRGGQVQGRHGTPEFGSTALTRRPESAGDALFDEVPSAFHAIEHHVDAITALPPDAVLLASSQACPVQAFRLGTRAWGVQFHPEVGADRVAGWAPESVREAGFDADEVVATARAHEAASADVCRGIATRFADLVRSAG